jgi:ABC-2 type transport system ATP-binding protein
MTAATRAAIRVRGLRKSYGKQVVLDGIDLDVAGGSVFALLGPNGAGKTTLMRAICGTLPLNVGTVRVGGLDPRTQREAQRGLALVPEEDASPGTLSARQVVRYAAALHGVRDRAAPERALAAVDLVDVADRKVGGFSKGMRQRARVAAALVGDPTILVLDEPLNGADPVQRVALIELFQRLGDEGRTVIVSSHVLHEVERLARRQIVLVRGRLAAAGDHHAIRSAIANRPMQVLVRSSDPRRLASALVGVEAVSGVSIDGGNVVVSSPSALDLDRALPGVARRADVRLLEVRPLDDSLESAFRELVR